MAKRKQSSRGLTSLAGFEMSLNGTGIPAMFGKLHGRDGWRIAGNEEVSGPG